MPNMKLLKILIAAAALLVLGLTACTPEDYAETGSSVPGAVPDIDETAYLMTLERQGITHSKGDSFLVIVGRDVVCATIDQEVNPSTAFIVGVSLGIASEFDTNNEAAYVTGAAIGAFCPEYSELIK